MTITGGSALPKDDIDKMVRDAEQYADDDRKRREEAEIRNTGEQLQYQTEKFLEDNGDKVPADVRGPVDDALGKLREALKGSDAAAITTASEELAKISQTLGQAVYAQSEAAAAAAGQEPAGTPDGSAGSDDDVVDAEIVDEPPTGTSG